MKSFLLKSHYEFFNLHPLNQTTSSSNCNTELSNILIIKETKKGHCPNMNFLYGDYNYQKPYT